MLLVRVTTNSENVAYQGVTLITLDFDPEKTLGGRYEKSLPEPTNS